MLFKQFSVSFEIKDVSGFVAARGRINGPYSIVVMRCGIICYNAAMSSLPQSVTFTYGDQSLEFENTALLAIKEG